MNTRWNRFLSLLLALTTVLSLAPAGFALDAAEDRSELPVSQEEIQPVETPEEAAEPVSDPTEQPEEAAEAEDPADTELPEEEAPEQEPSQPADPVPPAAGDPEDTPPADPEPQTPAVISEEDIEDNEGQEPADVDTGDSGTLPLQPLPTPVTSSYPTISIAGINNTPLAANALRELNDALRNAGAEILSMDQTAMECAALRASELSVYYSNEIRPSGENWSTVLGDQNIGATLYAEAIAYGTSDVQSVVNTWLSDPTMYRYLTSSQIRSVGIGCFYQNGGQHYWVLIATNQYKEPADLTASASRVNTLISCQENLLGEATLSASATTLNLTQAATLKLSLSNGVDSFVPNGPVSFSSSSDAVSVSSTGLVTAQKPGTAVITAKLDKFDRSASVTITSEVNLGTVRLGQIANWNGSVYLNWSSVTGATGYHVYRKNPGGSWRLLTTEKPVTGTSYADTSVASGITYIYTVRAQYKQDGISVLGGFDPAGLTTIYLATPNLGSATASATGVTVRWGAVQGAASYNIYRKTLQSDWSRVATVSSSATSYLDYRVTANTKYFYTVRAVSGSYISSFLAAGTAVTPTVTVSTEALVARKAVSYYTSTSTSGKAAGQISAGSTVNILSGWSKKVGSVTWYIVYVNGKGYYIPATDLLATPVLTSAVNAPAGIKVSWNKLSNCSGYLVYMKDSYSGWTRVTALTSNDQTSYVVPDDKLTSGTTYTFTIRAYYGKAYSDFSRTGISATYLKTPKLISAVSNGKDRITVSWEKVPNATGYVVYRKSSGTSWQAISKISSGATVSYQDTSAASMTTYTYTVRATIDKLYSSFYSAGISGILIPTDKLVTYVVTSDVKYRTGPGTNYTVLGTLKAGTQVQVISGWSKTANSYTWFQFKNGNTISYIASDFLIAPPTLGKISAQSNGITVTWSKVKNATGYALYRKENGGKWVRIANLSASTLSYQDTSLSSGTTYTYTVRASCSSVLSWFDTKGLSLCYLTTPSLTSVSSTSKGITINWSRVTGAKGYYIYRRTAGGAWSRISQVNSVNTISYQDSTNLLKGVTYYYTVRAFSGTSYSFYQSPGISAKAAATLNPVTKSYVTTGMLNYRDKPSTGKVIGTLKAGTTVQVIPSGATTVNGSVWYMIYLNGNCYYVSAKYLKEA